MLQQVSRGNTTQVYPFTKYFPDRMHEHSLFESLQQAGSSFGIVTEFHYKIYPTPEILPALILVYIDDKSDLWKFEAAANRNGKYHLCLHTVYFFTQPNWLAKDRKVNKLKYISM